MGDYLWAEGDGPSHSSLPQQQDTYQPLLGTGTLLKPHLMDRASCGDNSAWLSCK